MIKALQNQRPLALLLVVLYTVFLNIGYFMSDSGIEWTGQAPLRNLFTDIFQAINEVSPILIKVIYFLVILSQALYFNYIIDKYKVQEIQSYLPAFSYVLIASCLPQLNVLSPVLIANFFFLFALDNVISTYNKELCFSATFNIGFWVAMASLFYQTPFFFLIYFGMAVSIFKSMDLREWLSLIVGFITPYFLASTWYFWNDQLPLFWTTYLITEFSLGFESINLSITDYLILGIAGAILIISFYNALLLNMKNTVFRKKSLTIIIWFLLFSTGLSYLNYGADLLYFSLLFIPLAFVLSSYLHKIKMYLWIELLHMLLLTVIIYNQYVNFTNHS